MPKELLINIQPTGSTPRIKFDPTTQPVNSKNQEKFFWSNNDSEAHWPALKLPSGINKTFFIPKPVDGKPPDGPAPTSDAVFLQTPGTFNYVCAFHENETGTIVVS